MIVSLYAGGMTVRDIQHHLATTLGVDMSPDTISTITDAVFQKVMIWQNRQLDEFYPVIFLDALRVKIRDGHRGRHVLLHGGWCRHGRHQAHPGIVDR